MLNRKRRTALLLCAGMVLVLFLSSAFIACEAGHECVGEACKICECVAQTKALLQSFTLLGAVVLALLLLPAVIAVIIVLAMNLVGSLLISALVIFPAVSAMRLFRSFKAVPHPAAGGTDQVSARDAGPALHSRAASGAFCLRAEDHRRHDHLPAIGKAGGGGRGSEIRAGDRRQRLL